MLLRSLALNLAPAGNPEAIPIAQTNPPIPGTRKSGRISGSNITPINFTTPILMRSSAMMKNGKSEGNTTSHHIFNPRMEACKAAWGWSTREKVKKSVDMVRKAVFHFSYM
ncbi:SD04227p, putative [Bacillus cereus G9241]|nr:SD04227p, putative [Bacillus cereus G9241]BAR75211.1 hypothetical protein BASH2_01803 [Bacillus anthracis]